MKRAQGVTLIELIVTLSIFSFLSAALFAAFEQGRLGFQGGNLQVLLQQEARRGLDTFLREVRESASSTVTIYPYTDPLDGKRHEAIAFASARGDPDVAGEGSCVPSLRNDCFHTTFGGDPSWRSLVVYAFYQTATGEKQLRQYVDYTGVTYSNPAVFPFTFQGITATTITVRSATGVNIALTRGPDAATGGRPRVVIADHLEHEDQDGDAALDANENDGSQSAPTDDRDGELDYGARFYRTGEVVSCSLFLRGSPTRSTNTTEFIIVSLEGGNELRN